MLVYLSGSDSFMAREAISKLKTKYLEKNPDGVELIEIDATEPMRNWADLKTVPLFATSRLIIIKRAGELPVDEQDSLASILTDLPASSVVAIWDAKPLKANSALLVITNKAGKTISAEPLMGTALKNWITAQAGGIGFEATPETVNELVDQYGSDLWAIQTDLKTRGGAPSISDWRKAQEVKPFALFEYVRGKRWSELKKHLIAGHQRGEAVEMTIGSLAAAVRKNVSDPSLKRKMTDTLSEIDIALKSGLIESGDAIALLACYLPDGASTSLGASQKRVQWEVAWESLT
ncbi:MAG: polymerase III, delta subunit protein [Berkelbacteria bacterium GW2011_GWA2_46_7]|uniref:Polymerase III, delta subunit protein n=1 Tax=Berkelbacteria bacterium GW2011_GWA2_46_7 TaxID=1618335 RepID=A0A0G1QHK1_9BACT|nr:MAG: polymerase III, delta subunit protein [Berkelbacteria bacterium GW2011_GWA2_46_7]